MSYNEDKIYTQQQLNEAVIKAIQDMRTVIEKKEQQLEQFKCHDDCMYKKYDYSFCDKCCRNYDLEDYYEKEETD